MRKLNGYGPSLIVLATVIAVLVAGPRAVQLLTHQQAVTQSTLARGRLEQNDVLVWLNQAYRDIADVVQPSVVHISAQQRRRDRFGRFQNTLSSGSGWIYDEHGHIVTNYHVIENAVRLEVQLHTGQLRDAELVGFDQFTDIAVIKVDGGLVLPADRADPDQRVQRGDLVFAFGSPFDFRFSMTSGVVSGTGRSVGVIRTRHNQFGYESFIQIDAAINPGNSGGPLTDFLGRVIGMNTAIATGRPGGLDEGQFAGIGLAIPLHMIEPVVSQIIETGVVQKGFLGVSAVDLHTDLINELQSLGFIGKGVFVWDVRPEGPARGAGVLRGDVITAVNGEPIESMAQLRSTVTSLLPGEHALLTIWRYDREAGSGEELTIGLELGILTLPQVGSLPPREGSERLPDLGIERMTTSTRLTAERFQTEFHAGVVIEDVVDGSRLQRRGIEPGSIIVEVRGYPVEDLAELLDHLRGSDLELGALVRIVRPDGSLDQVELRWE